MAAYQQGAKRQKIREVKENDYFSGIEKMEYSKQAGPGEVSRYRHHSAAERLHNRTMEEWLKYSISLTEFRSNGSDGRGRPTHSRSWDDNSNSLENHKRCIKALFEFCSKLGVKYWTAFDTDLVPATDGWDECRTSWDDVIEFVAELSQRYHNCLETAQRLNAECFLIWPYREGYDSIFQTDVAKEIKLFSKLLKITAEYKDRLNYRCQLLLMPYGNDFRFNVDKGQHSRESELVNRYMWDITSCLYFLKNYNLERYYKVCTPPGHHMRRSPSSSSSSSSSIDSGSSTSSSVSRKHNKSHKRKKRGTKRGHQRDRRRLNKLRQEMCELRKRAPFCDDDCSSRSNLNHLNSEEVISAANYSTIALNTILIKINQNRISNEWCEVRFAETQKSYNHATGFVELEVNEEVKAYDSLRHLAYSDKAFAALTFCYDCKKLTLMMKCIVDQGAAPPGGINLQLVPRRDSDLRDLQTTYVKYIDAIAKGLRSTCHLLFYTYFITFCPISF
ncbi:Xylose isomerase [Operophtera brumata]|uniref:Xylose isomerase n=1 Tax=Operophtera brumata TaxID=104452 RepID=A0A0L7LAW3_OPEBR|nr:Xylose isomerase [Operophtera brumata]